MKAKRKTLYFCETCRLEWVDEEDVDDGCKESTIEKIIWICSQCDSRFQTEHEANECCANEKLMIAGGIEA